VAAWVLVAAVPPAVGVAAVVALAAATAPAAEADVGSVVLLLLPYTVQLITSLKSLLVIICRAASIKENNAR
jgi:hypothetical protein